MRRFIIVLLAMGALNAYAQGFIDLKARLAQKQLVENAEKARAKQLGRLGSTLIRK